MCVVNNYDVICVTESWLSQDIPDSELVISGYNVFRRDRNRHGGGIIIFVRDSLPCTILPTPISSSIELLSLTVEFCSSKFCISTFYRPPSSDVSYFDELYDIIEKLDIVTFSNYILLGDFNINFCNPTHPLYPRLFNLCNSFMLTQVVTEPTHTSPSGSQSLIDLVFLSHPSHLVHCYTSPPLGTSDHHCVSVGLLPNQGSTNPIKTNARTIWRYSLGDFETANDLLNAVNWEDLLSGDIDQMWAAWEEKFIMIMKQCIPTAELPAKPNLPWLNSDIIKGIRERNKAFKLAKKSGRTDHLNDYRTKCNRITNMIRDAKSKFFKGLNPSNPKTFWKLTKYLTKQSTSIPVLKDDYGNTIQDDTEKAELLNNFFSKCLNRSVSPLDETDCLNLGQPNSDECPEQLLCSEEEVLQMLLTLDTTKSNGPDGLSALMLKATATSIAPGITRLFNKSIQSGTVPEAWKISSVVPIPKGNKHASVSNYRPISLLPIISKLPEKHIHKLISSHLEVNYPIALQQWGFQPKKSTVSALLDVVHNWSQAIDQGKEICAVFFDLQKAFDTVPHKTLIDKLISIDLNPFLLRWVCSYLTNRKQFVVLNGEKSSTCQVVSGVPQGSVLGPLLFLVYINDSVEATQCDGNTINLFADDMLLYRVINSTCDLEVVQQGVNNVSDWVHANNLQLNSSKCKFMIVSRLRSRGIQAPALELNGHQLEKVLEYKYLGVTLTSNLSWSEHVDTIVCKTRKLVGMLYRQFYRWSSTEALYQLYISLVRPHLEYAAPVWSPYTSKNISKLEAVQKFALRMCLKDWHASYHDLLEHCHTTELAARRKYLSLSHFYKIIQGSCIFPNAPISRYTNNYPTRSQEGSHFVQSHARTNVLYHSFFPSTIALWNSLPPSVTLSSSVSAFKHNLLFSGIL